MSVITKDLGVATAYGYAKSKGYTGTEEEFAELMASYADVAQQAEASAQDAEDAKDAAITAKTAAQTAQTAAESAQTAAAGSAQTASTKASEASNSAQTAAGSATAAQTSATAAAGSAQTAQAAAHTATTKASEASSSASAASTAKTGAETARTGAQTAQTAAETAQANAEAAASSVSASAAQIEQNTEEIGAIKNDLNQLESAYSAFVVETETGAIASFSDGADDVPVKDLTVAIEPVQSGSGDPSPENVRPISGWTGANVTVNDEVLSVNWQTEAGTVYGGTLDVTNGVLTVDKGYVSLSSSDITNSCSLTDTAGGEQRLFVPATLLPGILFDNQSATTADLTCNQFVKKNANQTYSRSVGISLNSIGQVHIYGGAYLQTLASFANIAPIQVAYPLNAPQTYQLTPQEVSTILGQNNIFADTGNVTVQYRADTKLYIDKVLNT